MQGYVGAVRRGEIPHVSVPFRPLGTGLKGQMLDPILDRANACPQCGGTLHVAEMPGAGVAMRLVRAVSVLLTHAWHHARAWRADPY
jgi:hypothetical protein